MKKQQNVFCGNNLELLKNYPDNYFDSIVTDPPYGLGKEPNAEEMLKNWIEQGAFEVKGSGFMGKEWDAFVPQPIFWKEALRVLKHGGHVIAFYGTRTYDLGVLSMRLAGFEIRDCIQWVYGSGFPKSHNISKAIDKMHGSEREVIGKGKAGKAFNKVKGFGVNTSKSDDFTSEWDISKASTEEAKKWEGWGSALKPANEPIVLARKPLEKGLSIAENVLKWGTGAINIDASRIASNENLGRNNHARTFGTSYVVQKEDLYIDNSNGLGRFPSNVILTHHPDCKCEYFKYNGEEEINEDWNCHNDCPIKILDEQSGELKSGKMTANHNRTTNGSPNGIYGKFDVNHPLAETYGDKGGASRFFYVAKASQWERHYGLDNFEEKNSASSEFRPNHLEKSLNGESGNPYGRWKPLKNIHPTIKPIKLMQYLVRMITPPNGIILDPFSGSGTTGIACKIDDFEFVGLELDSEYVQIAKSRIEAFDVEKVFLDETKIYQNRVKNEQDDLSGFNQLNLFD
jgi:site-specific DNA-methyltransferase (adenine-specific)